MSYQPQAAARRAKFVPPHLSPWAVSRPRLLARLNEAHHFPVVLVSAAAGSGKTTLLAEWVHTLELPWGWLTIDRADGDFERFFSNVMTALSDAVPGFGALILAESRLQSEPHLDSLVAHMDDELTALDQDLVLVLDDVHRIDDATSVEFLSRLLHYPPPRLHLVMAARRDPMVAIGRLRSHGQLLELRAADLVLTPSETRALLQNAGVTDDLSDSIERRNEGWAVGIHLDALSVRTLRAQATVLGENLSSHQAGVHDLIVNEILVQQPEWTQRLLLVSSLVHRFNDDLCSALLDIPSEQSEMRPILHVLAAEGLLLFSLGGSPEWFRYHQLFRDVLRRELVRRFDEDEISKLHIQASAWFEKNEYISDAIVHALRAGDEVLAAEIVERHAQRALAKDLWPELSQWLELLPSELVRARPELSIAQGWIYQVRGAYSELQSTIDRAEVLIESESSAHSATEVRARRDDLNVLRQFLPSLTNSSDIWIEAGQRGLATGLERFASSMAVYHLGFGMLFQGKNRAMVDRVADVLEESRGLDDPFARQRELWARTLLGLNSLLEGDVRQAESDLELLLGMTRSHGSSRMEAQCNFLLGWIQIERNRLEDAIETLESVARERTTGIIVLVNSMLMLARAYELSGQPDEADKTMSRLADRFSELRQATYGRALHSAVEIEIAIHRGNLDQCARWVERSPDVDVVVNLASVENPLITRARVFLALGRLAQADDDLRRLEAQAAGPPHIAALRIRVGVLRALHTFQLGNETRAVSMLTSTAAQAMAGGFVRSLLDPGIGNPAFLELVSRMPPDCLPHSQPGIEAYFTPVRSRPEFEDMGDVATEIDLTRYTSPADQLTQRERDVMNLLLQRLSYKEIANELEISPLTVKSHSIHIYAKLGVSSRRQMIKLLERYDPVALNFGRLG